MAAPLPAQETAPRIGVLVPERVISQSARGHKLFAELDTLKKTLQEKLDGKVSEIQKLNAQLQSPSISESGKETIQKQMRDLDFEGKKLQEDSQQELQKTQQKVINQFEREIRPLVEDLAKEQKLQAVMNFQPGLFFYADEAWMLAFSDEIAKRYDAKFGPGAPIDSKPAAPKAPAGAAKPAAPKTAPKPAAPKTIQPAS
jgi:Skp family chaperone for outer membrane proteins